MASRTFDSQVISARRAAAWRALGWGAPQPYALRCPLAKYGTGDTVAGCRHDARDASWLGCCSSTVARMRITMTIRRVIYSWSRAGERSKA